MASRGAGDWLIERAPGSRRLLLASRGRREPDTDGPGRG